jgi:hypothetical protein
VSGLLFNVIAYLDGRVVKAQFRARCQKTAGDRVREAFGPYASVKYLVVVPEKKRGKTGRRAA